MYIGRIVSVAKTRDGRLCAVYRVSSRSFPNRTAVVGADKVSIVPKPGHETDVQKNPYIAYNCVRVVSDSQVAVVTNGSHTDAIAEKIAQGMPVRDALALAMLALDYEKDQYNTPRISAVADKRDGAAWLAVVRDDGI
ncbi:MAG TPA: IMP cyclohydrolase, partial [Candidatus Hydrogenedentes bacterium]|nr:IMP cyclohydrolase [Candidatus Hydrogenedentota bacterium]